ncbi:seven transmembrane MLO family protein [Klebsormidium nitens]|uniref:MLO-like protein n=1 Tax=Klebsormidium nitens TaxID=105231 RepID=A0A1Y1I217_KLENI|nr:seven transmembrane MLO family protein [Klebsormidium nitens]|eukprot:GAQ83221.1 seven transmembrane MLO family protein [Klebsormidium nitens]
MVCSGPDMLNTPSYGSGTIIGIFVAVSLIIERSIHYLGKYFKKTKNKQLLQALESIKEELMLLGFISLFLTVFQASFAGICVPITSTRRTFLLCNPEELPETEALLGNTTEAGHRRRLLAESASTCPEGRIPFIGVEAMHQIHTFIFVLAGVHILYSCVVMSLAYIKVERWAKWEEEAVREARAYYAGQSQKKDLTRVSTFQQRHSAKAGIWILDWAHCFLKSFTQAVAKADYKALRIAFCTYHNLSHDGFAFHKFLLRSLEADYSHVVGVTPFMWLFVVFFVIFDIPQGHIVFWLPDIFVMIILLVGAKLARVVQVLARDIDVERMGPCVGAHLRPRNSLFWFQRPSIMLNLMHFTLFTNSFQLASIIFYAWSFGVNSCYFYNRPFSYLRVVISVTLILFTSWVTLPAYALVSQMGSTTRLTIFGDHVQHHLKGWAKRAKAQHAPEEEANPVHSAIGSVLTLVHADGLFAKKQGESAKSAGQQPSDEDDDESGVKQVLNDGDLESAVRPPMVDDAEQTGDGRVDTPDSGTAREGRQNGANGDHSNGPR